MSHDASEHQPVLPCLHLPCLVQYPQSQRGMGCTDSLQLSYSVLLRFGITIIVQLITQVHNLGELLVVLLAQDRVHSAQFKKLSKEGYPFLGPLSSFQEAREWAEKLITFFSDLLELRRMNPILPPRNL